MKESYVKSRRFPLTALLWLGIVFCVQGLSAVLQPPTQSAQPKTSSPEADAAWEALQSSLNFPSPPASWQSTPPSQEEFETFRKSLIQKVLASCDLADQFATKFADDERSIEALKIEYQLLIQAQRFGATNLEARITKLETRLLAHPKITTQEKISLRFQQMHRDLATRIIGDGTKTPDVNAYHRGVAEIGKKLAGEFPGEDLPYELILSAATQLESRDEKQALVKEVMNSKASQDIKEAAAGVLRGIEIQGKPLELSFEALDGRKIDLKSLRGKVVLVDFWATWCGPCLQELPNVKKVYEKYNPQGFEIIGISLDENKEALQAFIRKEKIPWPQYFDGKGWKTYWARYYGIQAIPAMWLVDKKGIVRDQQARIDLEEKVKKLLAEKD